MSNEKRLVLCILLIFGWVTIAPSLFRSLGLLPPVKKAPAHAAADALKGAKKADEDLAAAKPENNPQAEAAKKVLAPPRPP